MAQEILDADTSHKFATVAIFSDNQGALTQLAEPLSLSPGQHIYTDNFFHMKLLGQPVRMYWCPGHEGIMANETADLLAKEAARGEFSLPTSTVQQITIPMSLAKTRQGLIIAFGFCSLWASRLFS